MHPAIERWTRRRKLNHEWEHSLHRYVTIGRRDDHLRAVWDAARGQRVSRWLTPANAERVRADCELGWRRGHVTGWVVKIGDAPSRGRSGSSPADPSPSMPVVETQ